MVVVVISAVRLSASNPSSGLEMCVTPFTPDHSHPTIHTRPSPGAQIDEMCLTPVCAVIPHHFNLPCAPWLNRTISGSPVIGLVGWVPPERELHTLKTALTQSRLAFRDEPRPGILLGVQGRSPFSGAAFAFAHDSARGALGDKVGTWAAA